MNLTPAQSQIAQSKARFRVVNCGRQFGKTTLAVEEIKGIALAKEAKIVYIAITIQQARDIAWQMLKEGLRSITTKSKEAPSLEITVKNLIGSTSLVQLRGWEAVETLRGQQFDFIVLDEVAQMRNFWLEWQEVLLPTLAFRHGSVMFISTPKGFNHFYDLFNQENTDKDFKSFHFTSYDNPHLPKEELESHKLKSTEDRFAQEYLADFRKTQGLVYKEFSRDRHLFIDGWDEIKTIDYIAGIDFGFTHPAAVIPIKVDEDEHYWVKNEWYKTGRTDAQIAEHVASCKFNRVYPDPESPGAIEALNQKGVNVSEVTKGKDSVQAGINKVRELFKQNRIHIHKDCVALISELETYSYPDKKPDHAESDKPIKENDDALDAFRYAIEGNQPQGRITKEEISERVITRMRSIQNQSK